MRQIGFGVLLSGLLASMASLQDAPKGPFTLAVDVPDGKNPVQVCSRPDTLKITMLDRFGKPAPISGVTVVISASDSRAPLNNLSGSTVNGVISFPDSVQWFTVGKHTIRACTKDGSAKGEKGGFDVKALPQGLSLKMTKPLPEPKFIQASSACQYEGKLDAKGEEVEDIEIRVKLSRGAMMFPQRVFTDRNGNFSFALFTPIFDCSVLGGGGGDRPVPIANALKGSPTLTMDIFLDPTNSGTFTPNSDQIGDVCPPIPITTPCPSDLLLSALAELTILVNGHEVMPPPPGPIVAAAVAAPNVGKKPGEENSQQERLEDAERFLRKEIIGFINSGKWDGHFSHVVHRIDHLVKFLRNIPTASSISLRLHCAGETLKKDPDVKNTRLTIQEKDHKKAEVAVGFKANLGILLEGVDKKVLPVSAFDPCTSPFLNSLTSRGPAKITLTPNFQLNFGFECTGVGGVSLSPGVQFVPQTVTDITDSTTVSADRVFSGAKEVALIEEVTFPLNPGLGVEQKGTGCLVTKVSFQIIEKRLIDLESLKQIGDVITSQMSRAGVHTGIPHSGDHPEKLVDEGVSEKDPNMRPPNIPRNLAQEEVKNGQGEPIRIFPDFRGVVTAFDLYDIVQVTAEVVGAKETDFISFRSFDVDDPTSSDPKLDDERQSRDNVGQLTAGTKFDANNEFLGLLVLTSEEGFWIVNGRHVRADQITRAAVTITDPKTGRGTASVLFRVSHNPGDNFKIAAACSEQENLLKRSKNVDRPSDRDTDGLLLYLYKSGTEDSDRPDVAMRERAWTNEPEDPVKVTPTLTVWRTLFVESDKMERADGDKRQGKIVRIVESLRLGREKFAHSLIVNLPGIPIWVRRFENGFFRIGNGDPTQIAFTSHIKDQAGLNIGGRIIGQSGNNIGMVIEGAIDTAEIEEAFENGTPVFLFDDDWKIKSIVHELGAPNLGAADLEVKTNCNREVNFGRMSGKGKTEKPEDPDNWEKNAFAQVYIRPNYDVLKAENANPTIPNDTNLPDGVSKLYDRLVRWPLNSPTNFVDSKIRDNNLFWTVYVSSGFQFKDAPFDPASADDATAFRKFTNSNEPDVSLKGTLAQTDGPGPVLDGKVGSLEVSVLALETIRDIWTAFGTTHAPFVGKVPFNELPGKIAEFLPKLIADAEKYAVVHEVVHHFLGGDHAPTSAWLFNFRMPGDVSVKRIVQLKLILSLENLRFTAKEASGMRTRVVSPGQDPAEVYGR